jgi:hypothetical protein
MRVTETDVQTVSRPIFKVKYVKRLQKLVHAWIVLNLSVLTRLLPLIHFERIPSSKHISLCSTHEECCPISYFAIDSHLPSGDTKCAVHSKWKRLVTLHTNGASPPRHATCRYLFPLAAVLFRVAAILVLNSPVKVDKPLYCRTLLPTFKTDTVLKSIEIVLVGYVLSCLNFVICGRRFTQLLQELNRD